MALINDYGKPNADPGKAFFYGIDADTGKEVSFVIRQLPLDVEETFRKRYIRKQRSRATGLIAREFDNRYTLNFLQDRVSWMWVDSVNFEIRVKDEEGAEFYREHVDGTTVEVGGVVKLDGKLSDDVKRRIITGHPDIADFIIDKSIDMRDEASKAEAEQGKD